MAITILITFAFLNVIFITHFVPHTRIRHRSYYANYVITPYSKYNDKTSKFRNKYKNK
jgi:hypothetical protein